LVDLTREKLTDTELKALVDVEIESAMGYISGELADERATAMDRYLGEPLGTEMEGRSQVSTRDVMEVIEWIMPTLIKIFTATDRAVEFIPEGPEDEQQAEQEADYLNHVFYKENQGFLILYTWFKDALLQKNGITKTYVEEFEKVTKESYKGLLDDEYRAMVADEELEVEEHSTEEAQIPTPQGPVVAKIHNVTFVRTRKDVRYVTDVIPPEEFLISRDTRSVNPTKARFCAHRTTMTVSELREMGYSDSDLMKMELGESIVELGEERISRNNLTDEERWDEALTLNTGMRKVKITECYLMADRDGDGIAELLKIFRSGDFIDVEEIDYHPINALTPNILTHKFYGLSVADIIQDIQEERTMLLRAYFDNVNQMINGKTYYDLNTASIDDLLTDKPFGLVAVDGNPHEAIFVKPSSGLPPEAYTLNDLLDKFLHSRVGDFQTQLDPNVLAQANTGVVINMLNETKSKVEMIARIFAEVGVKELFRTYHHLIRKHADRETRFRLKNTWVPVDPREWRERTNLTVKVGLGTQNNQEMIANLTNLLNTQMQMIQMGVPVLLPQNVHAAAADLAEAMGLVQEKYWTSPEKIPPPPPQADPQMELIKLQQQVESARLQLQQQEMVSKQQLDAVKTELERIKSAQTYEKELAALQLKARELDLKDESDTLKAALDKYKADLNAEIELFKQTVPEAEALADKLLSTLGEGLG